MVSSNQTWPTKFLILYILFISTILYLLQSLIFHKLMLGNHTIPKIKKKSHLPLRFSSDGTFKILQIADMHYGTGILTSCRDVLASEFKYCSDLNTTLFVQRLILDEKPDFVAFTGDNIFGSSTSDAAESLIKAFRPVMDSKLPWAAVLGNHDQESTMTREELMSFISLMDYSLSEVNPSTYDHLKIDGFGNYDIQVNGAWGSHLANTSVLNLYFLDSGDRAVVDGVRTYGWIKESQLHWLQNISEGNKLNEKPPALTFFHIPIPEVKDLWYTKFVGLYQEGVASSTVNSGVLQTLVSMGDVKAVFIGHDHLNDFCGKIDGIWFCYGGGTGYHGYGRGWLKRRARVVVMELEKGNNEWMGIGKIKTWKRLDDSKFSKIDEQVLWDRGDMIYGTSTSDAAESLIKAFKPVMDSKLPWAAVLGNHDQESTMTCEELMFFLSLLDYSLSQVNPSTYDHLKIDGFGNYDIQVYGPWGSHFANTSVLNLYFLDSGDKAVVEGVRIYGWIKESQLHWLQNTSQGNQLNEKPPALAFFHIPIPEVKDLWCRKFVGLYQEGVASSTVNSGVLQTLISMGNGKAVFIAHDHLNDFCGKIDGIWFCYGGGTGYHAYERSWLKRRARVVVMELEKGKNEWMGVEKIKTWKRLDDSEFSKIDEQVLWDRGSLRAFPIKGKRAQKHSKEHEKCQNLPTILFPQ